ncbi:hypothetical protein R6V09_12440 [Streptomyces sp. W16]|uniref:hypothetical protein n=1 Tax=Streptomyces sp. W16 TaxID=3076631 RepID=UPI00295AD383|nr:hypothetical protein [Streptomyces sp. W16]MDV9170940.1 hypothetical protein [Streptomyces sp. W16]
MTEAEAFRKAALAVSCALRDDDQVGAGYNRARQKALAAGVQVMELHHLVKRGANGTEPNTMADIYGSVWITSGAGSIVLLWGEAGDPVISFRHLKQPMDEVGPLHLAHDHTAGRTSVMQSTDLLEMARISGAEGLTALAAAEALFESKKVSRAQKEKARRRLERLTEAGKLTRVEPGFPGASASYYYVDQGTK